MGTCTRRKAHPCREFSEVSICANRVVNIHQGVIKPLLLPEIYASFARIDAAGMRSNLIDLTLQNDSGYLSPVTDCPWTADN
jgi:hypothetical protein